MALWLLVQLLFTYLTLPTRNEGSGRAFSRPDISSCRDPWLKCTPERPRFSCSHCVVECHADPRHCGVTAEDETVGLNCIRVASWRILAASHPLSDSRIFPDKSSLQRDAALRHQRRVTERRAALGENGRIGGVELKQHAVCQLVEHGAISMPDASLSYRAQASFQSKPRS